MDDFVAAAVRARKAGSTSSTSSTATATSATSCSRAVAGRARTAAASTTALRFLASIADGIRADAPGLEIGVRLSAFDFVPFKPGPDGIGVPEVERRRLRDGVRRRRGSAQPATIDGRPRAALASSGAGHPLGLPDGGQPVLQPAHPAARRIFPPSDGYQPPEDPLVGVARQIAATARAQGAPSRSWPSSAPATPTSRSGCRTWRSTPSVTAWPTSVGLGRIVLSYPDMPADMLAGRPLKTKLLCRTFSDCTTAPRNGLVSGCYPLDPFFVKHEHAVPLKQIKKTMKAGTSA